MSLIGTPQSPKPPTASVAPSSMSATASRALATTLSMHGPLFSGWPGRPSGGPSQRADAVDLGSKRSRDPFGRGTRGQPVSVGMPAQDQRGAGRQGSEQP